MAKARSKNVRGAGLSQLALRTEEPPISWLMGAVLKRPKLISLAAGFTDSVSLPATATRELLANLLRDQARGRAALQYGSTPGLPELRQLTALRLSAQDRLPRPVSPDNVVITSGSQQLLYILTECLCDPGDIVLVEDPTYFVYLGILQSHGLRVRAIRMDEDGIHLKHLEQVLRELRDAGELPRLKLLYLVSYFQNPTGRTTSFQKKAAALALLKSAEKPAGHPIYLLEDAAYRELRFAGEAVPSALATGNSERVLYAGTYSKPFATGVRIGFGVLPDPVLEPVLRIKGNHDFGSPNLLAYLLADALRTTVYDDHLERIRARYDRKSQLVHALLARHFPAGKAAWQRPSGGLYVWVQLPQGTRTGPKSAFFQEALAQDVLFVPGELCYADDVSRPRPRNELRISFGAATEKELRLGIRRLGDLAASRVNVAVSLKNPD